MFTALLKNLKENRRTIVFTEGPDARIQDGHLVHPGVGLGIENLGLADIEAVLCA